MWSEEGQCHLPFWRRSGMNVPASVNPDLQLFALPVDGWIAQ